tara:strand:+ start:222 stop:509 length:288 start_codon:yes stop_codon:yes gene_type:complete
MLLDKLYSEDGEIWVFDDNLYLLKKYFNKLEDLFDNESHLINQCKAMEFYVKEDKISYVKNPNHIVIEGPENSIIQPNGRPWVWLYELHLEYCGK